VVLTAHVFYEDFADELLEALTHFPKDTRVLATTPSEDISAQLKASLDSLRLIHDVRVTPNLGRNFGPLLVEFSDVLKKVDSFIHVHSKKSIHSPRIAKEWLRRSTDLLLSATGIQRCFDILRQNEDVGIIYADSSDLIRGINFRWGRSKRQMMQLIGLTPGFENIKWSGRILFPAGGMFWVRTDAIRPLLELDWKYEMFPEENGQIDGGTQHGIERLLGEVTQTRGYRQALYLPFVGRFFSKTMN
jgi:lipopolysaccharide biosynthesis protein